MSDIFHSEEYKGHKIEIFYDKDAESPECWEDENLFLVADHREFYVEAPKGSTFASVEDDYKKTHHIFGLEAYIHSGVALALVNEGGFPDRKWDVSELGRVFVAKEEARTRKKARELALGLIKTWNMYLSGSVYGYSVDDRDEKCHGYYEDSYNPEEMSCVKEARNIIDGMVEEERKAKQERTKTLIKNRVPLLSRV